MYSKHAKVKAKIRIQKVSCTFQIHSGYFYFPHTGHHTVNKNIFISFRWLKIGFVSFILSSILFMFQRIKKLMGIKKNEKQSFKNRCDCQPAAPSFLLCLANRLVRCWIDCSSRSPLAHHTPLYGTVVIGLFSPDVGLVVVSGFARLPMWLRVLRATKKSSGSKDNSGMHHTYFYYQRCCAFHGASALIIFNEKKSHRLVGFFIRTFLE